MNEFLSGKNSNSSNRGNSFVRDYLSFVFKDPEIALRGFRGRDNNDLKDIDKVIEPPKPQLETSEFEDLKCKNKFKNRVMKFWFVMNANFDQETLKNLRNNIKSVKIVFNNHSYEEYKGLYDPDDNMIILKKGYLEQILFHELFHMASSLRRIFLSKVGGFRIISNNFLSIGEGLDEGYTDNMMYKFFYEKNRIHPNYVIRYPYEFLISRALDYVIGKETMEKLYLKASLHGLINELLKYTSKESIDEFLKVTDNAMSKEQDALKDEGTKTEKIITMERRKEYIRHFLLEIFYNKYSSCDDFDDKLNEYSNILTMELEREYEIKNPLSQCLTFKKKKEPKVRTTRFKITDREYINDFMQSKKRLTK